MRHLAWPLLVASALQVACSSSDATPAKPTACKKTDRQGVYRVTFATQSGNCGELPESLINLDGTPAPGSVCKINQQTYSENDCKLVVDELCPIKGGGENHTVAVTTQDAADGSRLSGAFTVQVTGTPSNCTGTYGISAVRQ